MQEDQVGTILIVHRKPIAVPRNGGTKWKGLPTPRLLDADVDSQNDSGKHTPYSPAKPLSHWFLVGSQVTILTHVSVVLVALFSLVPLVPVQYL